MTALIGMKAICGHVFRSESTVLMMIRDMDFPATKIGGIWESDEKLIAEWRKQQINGRSPAESKQEVKTGRKKTLSSVKNSKKQ
jgi:hypothetical protein